MWRDCAVINGHQSAALPLTFWSQVRRRQEGRGEGGLLDTIIFAVQTAFTKETVDAYYCVAKAARNIAVSVRMSVLNVEINVAIIAVNDGFSRSKRRQVDAECRKTF